MENLHRLPDGSRLLIWEEWNQARGLILPVRRGTGPFVYRQDVLGDLTSELYQGSIYYAYHSLDHRILLGTAGEREVTAVLSDPSDQRRYSRLRLLSWQDELWLFFCAFDPSSGKWELRVMRPLAGRETAAVWEGFPKPPELSYRRGERLMILWGEKVCFFAGYGKTEKGEILTEREGAAAREAILSLRENREQELERVRGEAAERLAAVQEWYGSQLKKAKAQYDELAAYASSLQEEGKRWRERYYKERGRGPTARQAP